MEKTEYFVYVIESIKDGIWYVGLSQDPAERIKQHNRGKSKFTKGHIPWKLLYKEQIGSLAEARKKERYYKTAAGKRRLKKLLGTEYYLIHGRSRGFPV